MVNDIQCRFLELSVTTQYAEAAAQLPLHHRNPFDRMLVAQAIAEQLILISADGIYRVTISGLWMCKSRYFPTGTPSSFSSLPTGYSPTLLAS